MKLFFWQNTNSIHQSAFFNALANVNGYEVTLIITEALSAKRVSMGWKEPVLTGVKVVSAADFVNNWQSIIDANSGVDCIHVFSGIAAFPGVHQAFKYAVARKCIIGVLSEPMDERGWKGKLRMLRGYVHKMQYGKKIAFLLGIGGQAVRQYQQWGYAPRQIFHWAYTIERLAGKQQERPANQLFKLAFVGSMIHRKGYDLLIQALESIGNDAAFSADFYCVEQANKEQALAVQNASSLKEKLRLLDFLPNEVMRERIAAYDLLVLPSRHDGWGAVISEALMAGTPVLVSKFCGSSVFINKNAAFLGEVIEDCSVAGIASLLQNCMKQGTVTDEQRQLIKNWAGANISGEAMAGYFSQIVHYVHSTDHNNKPYTAWSK
ncbi:Glycosyltransferase involved in cell wall bisynthesis [Filimonas lacunae]|uniref:Glycosyltransferase involved in cell wall bisynthesis n=1 Tax=Filimonas lacunae TaxID=477680 RepID=A0A173M9V1_9BACT|nr:glycosyltransferase family 4 protein [Filimonas lacunae]BAV04291.1 hypothetical protein FLA_0277 [Filimonas lacunae]SIT30923.1 Glycosyltransferase involved in cell wall bisynthesis [Filimonas lacunae]